MNPLWFGDSFDLVKRFFVETLNTLGYQVEIDPMLTGEWNNNEANFYKLLKVSPQSNEPQTPSVLLLDPDTGIGSKTTKSHTSIKRMSSLLDRYDMVFSFDQSFSRSRDALETMHKKLAALEDLKGFGFYYDSHARFLFASRSKQNLKSLIRHLLSMGLPFNRIIKSRAFE